MQCWWVSWRFSTKGIGTTNTFSPRYTRDNVGLCVFAHTKKCKHRRINKLIVKPQFDVIKMRVKKQRYSPLLLVCSDVGLV